MAKRPNTPNFDWPLLFSQGLQVNEINVLNETLTKIDGDVFNLGETLKGFKVSFKDIQDLPNTLDGYGIVDAYTDTETDAAIKAACDALKGEAPDELSTLAALAAALADDPKFSETIAKALAKRVAVDSEQTFKLSEKRQARLNIEAIGAPDRGAANGVAPLDANSKIPQFYIPAQTTTATVGAAVAAANGQSSIADGDSLTGVLAGTGTLVRWTWGNIVTWLRSIFYTKTEIGSIVAGNMAGRAYPRRSDGAALNLVWAGQGGTPAYLWGGGEPGTTFYPYSPAQMSVNYANSANTCNNVGGWTAQALVDRIEDRSYWRSQEWAAARTADAVGCTLLLTCVRTSAIGINEVVDGSTLRVTLSDQNGQSNGRSPGGAWRNISDTVGYNRAVNFVRAW